MKLIIRLLSGVLMLSLAAGTALAADADKAKKQGEIRKVTQTTLQRFYKANAKLKAEVNKSPGYGVFTTYGLSFLIGGAGGSGLVHNRKTGKDTFMKMGQASAGLQIGASQTETLIIFKTAKGMADFVDKGWEFGGGGAVEAGAGGKTAGLPEAGGVVGDALYYTLTKNGLQAGVAAAGTKFWKDADLN
jgi:lipid-binding SYLF domain-containing protein